MPTAIAPLPMYRTGLEPPPAMTATMPIAIAPIGRYIRAWARPSEVTSGSSGGDSSRISPCGTCGTCGAAARVPFAATVFGMLALPLFS